MNKLQQQVREFHETFDLEYSDEPKAIDLIAAQRRVALIREELDELCDAFTSFSIPDIADALGDLLYVVYGTAVECGIDMDPITDEIHRSNMTKVGGHKNHYGKWIKPDTYEPPNLEPLIEKMYI